MASSLVASSLPLLALVGYLTAYASAQHLRPRTPYVTYADPGSSELGRDATQSITTDGADRVFEYNYRNFNGDLLTTRGRVPVAIEQQSIDEYGMPEAALGELNTWYQQTWADIGKRTFERDQAAFAVGNQTDAEALARHSSRDEQFVAAFNAREADAMAGFRSRDEPQVAASGVRETEALARFKSRDDQLVAAFDTREAEAMARYRAKLHTESITAPTKAELDASLAAMQAENDAAARQLDADRAASHAKLDADRALNQLQIDSDRAVSRTKTEEARSLNQRQIDADRAASHATIDGERAANHAQLAADRQALVSKRTADVAEDAKQAAADYAVTTAERARRKRAIYADAGLRFLRDKLAPDVRKLVQRNGPRLYSVSAAMFQAAKQRGYGLADAEGAVISMVQTAVGYKVPPDRVLGKDLLGLLPPPYTLGEGWGDCDTKSALAASLLSSWNSSRMIGVGIPGHYLLGLQRVPTPGDVYVEWDGLPFVLTEAAGPGSFLPGHPFEKTLEFIKGGGKPDIEPLY